MSRFLSKTLRPTILLLPALLLFSACGPVSFPAGRLPEAVRELCKKEQKLDVDAHLIGKTLYLSCSLKGLIGLNLDFQKDALEILEGVMLSGTRAALSTDAPVDFLMVKVKDARLGSTISLLRYVPDIKGLIYMRYSRSDFEDRLVLETDGVDHPKAPAERFHDITLAEFMARLVASRLHRQLTGNPLVSVFLRIQGVRGTVEGKALVLELDRVGTGLWGASMSEVLRSAVTEVSSDVTKKFDPRGERVQAIRVKEKSGALIWETPVAALALSPKTEAQK